VSSPVSASEPDTTGQSTSRPKTDTATVEQAFERDGLSAVRAVVAAFGASTAWVQQMVLIANELASNAVSYAGGRGRLRLWRDGQDVYCQIVDRGPGLADPDVAGTRRPPAQATGGRGLWIVRHLCDHLDIASSPHGTTITATMHLDHQPTPGSDPATQAGSPLLANGPEERKTGRPRPNTGHFC
jgi:anti-sigma regulatory factor (Ser/Thr protein kinase)